MLAEALGAAASNHPASVGNVTSWLGGVACARDANHVQAVGVSFRSEVQGSKSVTSVQADGLIPDPHTPRAVIRHGSSAGEVLVICVVRLPLVGEAAKIVLHCERCEDGQESLGASHGPLSAAPCLV